MNSLISTACARGTVALLAAATAALTAPTALATQPGTFTTKGAWKFLSARNLHPPKLKVRGKVSSHKLAPGYFLVDNFPSESFPGPMIGQGGPLILDNKLQPVWFSPTPVNLVSSDLQQETYNGQPVLVWWQGLVSSTGATTRGEVLVVDQHYRKLADLKAKRPWLISLHDAQIDGKTIWVTVYRRVPGQNLKRYHGSAKGTLLDAGVQQYDLRTGKLLFTWDAFKHIPLSDSRQSAAAFRSDAWDAYHLNAVQPLPGGQMLVSLRNTWAAYLVNAKTGRIVWTLGGRHSSFKSTANARFAWQHDVQLLSGNRVTVFNDNCCEVLPNHRLGPNSGPSAGLVLMLNLNNRTVSRLAAYRHRPDQFIPFLGSMQLLAGGNSVVGWGSSPSYFSEYDSRGNQLLDALFPGKDQSYRARFTSTWVGTPAYRPSAAVRRTHGKATVYASWNGATQVARWQLEGGASGAQLKPVATRARSGFETSLSDPNGADKSFKVVALDSHGHQLGSSTTIKG